MKHILLSVSLLVFSGIAIFGVPAWRANPTAFGAPPPNETVEFVLQVIVAVLPVVIATYPKFKPLAPFVTDIVTLIRNMVKVDWTQFKQVDKKP